MPCCGIDIQDGVPAGSGGGSSSAAAEWTERYLGDFSSAPAEDLATGTTPTVAVANGTMTSGQVASVDWTSNFNDPIPAVAMGSVTSFGTDGSTGLVFQGASASTNFTNTAANAPHVWALWSDLLGEDPRPGVDYAIVCRYTSDPSAEILSAAQAAGVGVYWPNDGVPEANIAGNPAIDDEKSLRGWFELVTNFSAVGREDSTAFQRIQGSRLPSSVDTIGLLFRGGGQIYVICSAGAFVDPDAMTMVPGGYQGGSISYPGRPYLDPTERVALPFQQQAGSTFDLTLEAVRVLSRGGAP